MTNRLKQVIDQVRDLPAERQDEIAATLEALLDAATAFTCAQNALISEGVADADAGRFASHEEVKKLFGSFGAA